MTPDEREQRIAALKREANRPLRIGESDDYWIIRSEIELLKQGRR